MAQSNPISTPLDPNVKLTLPDLGDPRIVNDELRHEYLSDYDLWSETENTAVFSSASEIPLHRRRTNRKLAQPPYPFRSAHTGRFLPRPKPAADLSDDDSSALSSVSSRFFDTPSTPRTPATSPAPQLDPAIIHAALATLTQPSPLTYDPDMAETLILFRGDAAGENATDFLNSIKRRGLTTPGFDDSKKIEYFELSLKSGSYAKSWLTKLDKKDKDTWEHLTAAFGKEWPEKEMAVRDRGELQEELLAFVLPPGEIGVRTEEDGVLEWGHVRWVVKAAELAVRAGDTGGNLIGQVLKNVPDSLMLRLGPKRKTWDELVQSMKDIPAADIASVLRLQNKSQAQDSKLAELEKTIATLQTPTRGLANQFAGMAASSPVRPDNTGTNKVRDVDTFAHTAHSLRRAAHSSRLGILD
ncbi:hypothetical protein C8R46DRAFT_1283769 [Mycena filopes]|nr:hypothetical protein C8R46DRAFT_1283769 [Mycena filopes]